MKELAKKIIEDGYKVYANDHKDNREITYIYFTDGKKIGYAQTYYSGIQFSTVHKPNRKSGTGFSLEEFASIEDYPTAFTTPPWAYKYPSNKWDSWEEFLKHDYFKDSKVEVNLCMLCDHVDEPVTMSSVCFDCKDLRKDTK